MSAADAPAGDALDLSLADDFLATLQPSVAWVDDHVEIIDQTELPTRLDVLSLRSVADVVDVILRLAVRGAPAIGSCGALGMVVGLDERAPADAPGALSVLDELVTTIGDARPTAVNLSWAVRRFAAPMPASQAPLKRGIRTGEKRGTIPHSSSHSAKAPLRKAEPLSLLRTSGGP